MSLGKAIGLVAVVGWKNPAQTGKPGFVPWRLELGWLLKMHLLKNGKELWCLMMMTKLFLSP
jgi:hypothetical protein